MAARLVRARQDARLTQVELARSVGVAQSVVSRIEAGDTQRSKYLIPIAQTLGVSPEWLAQGVGPARHATAAEIRRYECAGAETRLIIQALLSIEHGLPMPAEAPASLRPLLEAARLMVRQTPRV
ncbi:helix-turn-helix transcriptional regulator [Achromobacter sp. GG226]|nr:helix-turn-helix transcriptional regulator [Verticiella sp. GG226]